MAECYDRPWRVGSKARGTRSQFRLDTGLLPFKCTYPAHLTDVMDVVPSTNSDLRRASPVKGTRTRTVREYEQTIEELKKENFDLKLRIFLLEDGKNKNYHRNKGASNEEQENSVQVIVELKVETESLRNELASKSQLLQEALNEKEKFESDLKELQSKFEELQEHFSSLSPNSSDQELRLLKDENEHYTQVLVEKDQNIELLNAQVEELLNRNKALEAKVEKSSLAIQGIVSKYYKDIDMIPKELRPVVQSAVQAAKQNNPDDLNVAFENIKASLSELMFANGGTSSDTRSKAVCGMNSSDPELRLLKGENEQFTQVLAEKDQNIELLNAQVEELLSKNKALRAKVDKSILTIQGIVSKYYKDIDMIPKELRAVVQSAVQAAKQNNPDDLNVAFENIKASLSELMFANEGTSTDTRNEAVSEKDSMEELTKLYRINKSSEDLAQRSQKSHQKSKHVHDETDQVSSESLHDSEVGKSRITEDLDQMLDVLKENESLKVDNAKKAKNIDELTSACWELERKSVQLQSELLNAVTKAKDLDARLKEEKSKQNSSLPMTHSSVQTAVQWHLMQSKLSDKFAQNAGRSNNLEVLKEEILTLLLVIEEKDKEISDCEEKLASLQQQLEMENKNETTFANLDTEFVKEKDDLHQRLAHSCAVNNQLMKHLRNLEIFMEDLLQHRNLDTSSIENISDSSSILSHMKIQREIAQSLELSTVLNDELSICEGSLLFNPNDFTRSRDYSHSARYSYQPTDTSRFGLDLSNIPSNNQGRKSSQLSIQETSPNAVGTGKRRLSFSTLHNSSLDATLCDKENVVVLGTSNNEDLILLLNEKGDPEDVFIRNNHSHLERSQLDDGEHRRRCWESSAMSYLNAEKSVLDHRTEQWCSSKVDSSKVVSGWLNPYPSSDSDIWSEPDRDVSLQRIGIDLQKSPVSQKSPRRSRFRDKLTTDDVSSLKNESSSSFSKLHTWSKQRKNSGTSKSSFICKKCMTHSQTSDAPSKDEKMDLQKVIDELTTKCHSQENHLENVINELKMRKNMVDALTKEKQELLNSINRLKEPQKSLIENEKSYIEKLEKMNSEYNKLQTRLKQFETKIIHTDTVCDQLKGDLEKSKIQLKVLEQKCLEYVEENAMHKNAKVDYTERLRVVENEKTVLIHDIESIMIEKGELLSKIEAENKHRQRLETENNSLINKMNENSKEVSLLRASTKDLKETKDKLLEEKELFENSLMSSNSMCKELKKDLKKTRERLEKMELKCAKYEEELNKSLKSKENITQSLSGVKSVISSNIGVLTSLCKQYVKSDVENEIDSGAVLSDVDKDEQIEMLLEEIISINSKFEQIVKFLSEQLSSVHSALEKNKMFEDENKSKILDLQRQLEDKEKYINSLRLNMVEVQQKFEDSKSVNKEYLSKLELAQKKLEVTEKEIKTLKDKEQSLVEFNLKASASEKQLSALQDEVKKYHNLINLKDDEITKLQERVFNLQTQINGILSKATYSAGQGSSSRGGGRSFENEINDEALSTISNDTSFSSITSEKEEEISRKVDRYSKKIRALQAKLSMTEKRIEILEKEKAGLREELLAQIHGEKEKSKSFEEIDAVMKELDELKSTLKTKTSFIKDLKSELFKTCNSLVDKQKEVDELQHKLSANNSTTEVDPQSPIHSRLRPSYSDPIQKATETNIKELKKHKWELIQGILSHQKQLYERKNIHLGHFEKFKKHIEKLRLLQVPTSLFKSESEPLLNTPMPANSFYAEKCDRTLKNLQIELQLDVECLQNLKIFLKRFFMPLVLQNCTCNNTSSKPDDDSHVSGKSTGSETKDFRREHLRLDLWKSNSEVVRHPTTISTGDRLIATTSVVAHKLDSFEIALKEMKSALEHFKETDSSIKETPKKTAAKSLLLKILDRLVNLDETFTEVFHLNSDLKSLGLFDISIPQSPSKQESDRESFLSEETIALSRCGSLSPMSFEENIPYRLFFTGMKQKSESGSFGKSLGMKQSLDVCHRSQAVGGSQESIFLRSHFSSPDLGIESDPNHESSAPEQAEKEVSNRVSKSSSKIKDASFGMSDVLHAIGYLQEFELLKKEVQESLVGIKIVLSRTGDGLHHLAKFTSPQKSLEYSTFKAIKDSCGNIEVCLQKAVKLIDNFWIAPCPSVKEFNMLIQQNQELQDKMKLFQESKRKQEINFNEVMEKFKHAERLRENMEKKISKKLIKTKKVIRQAEIKILKKESQDLPSIPKYPFDESACQKS